MSNSIRENVARVAVRLGELNNEVMLVGGAAVHFLVPQSLAADIRTTEDIDLVVSAKTMGELYEIGVRLREQGFHECTDEGAPTCRWVIDGILVDVMPTGESASASTNRWYEKAMADATEVELAPGLRCKMIDLAPFVATKFEAFRSRGDGDYIGNRDFEDIVCVVAYREDAVERILETTEPLRSYLVEQICGLCSLRNLSDLVSGCFASGRESQQWVAVALGNFYRVAAQVDSAPAN